MGRAGGGHRLACRRSQCRRNGRNRRGLARNDQLLARRQCARPLVTIGLQDRRGRNVIAARQSLERVAGADDDRGAALSRGVDRRDRARGDRGGGLDRMARRSVRGQSAPSSRHAAAGGRIGLRRRNRRRQRLRLVLRIAAGILRQFAALDRRRSAPSPWLPTATQRDWRRDLARVASTCRRCSRQNRSTSAPAPRRAVRGASKATRRHGTWLLTRTQQITVLSKHLPSKQPLKLKNKMFGGTARSGFYSSRAMPGSAGTKRTSTSSLRSKPASVLVTRTRVWAP